MAQQVITARFDNGIPAIAASITYDRKNGGDSSYLSITLRDDAVTQWRGSIEDCQTGLTSRDDMTAFTLETFGELEADAMIRFFEWSAYQLRRLVHNDTDMEFQMRVSRFRMYLNEFMQSYLDSGSKEGISTIAQKHHVTSLSKEMFDRVGLSEVTQYDLDSNIWYDFSTILYRYLLGKSDKLPVWHKSSDDACQLGTYDIANADSVQSDTPSPEQQYDEEQESLKQERKELTELLVDIKHRLSVVENRRAALNID